MTIHHKAARLVRATELAELCLKRLNGDRRNPKLVHQAAMAMKLCDRIQSKIKTPKPE